MRSTGPDSLPTLPRHRVPAWWSDAKLGIFVHWTPASVPGWSPTHTEIGELFADDYRAAPDGLVNDRWMPWSRAMSTVRFAPVRRLIDSSATKSARKADGIVPPRPPHFDVRTPEYVTFDEVPRDPWECVRGINRSFGYNRSSLPEHFLTRDELLAMLAEITSTGGNLLLNVGPRGEDAQIPAEQLQRLGWLVEWTGGAGSSVFGSRPWVRPSDRSPEGARLRYWTHDVSLFVAINGDDGPVCTVPGVAATPAAVVTDAGGAAMQWSANPSGLRVETPTTDTAGPMVTRFDHAGAAARTAHGDRHRGAGHADLARSSVRVGR